MLAAELRAVVAGDAPLRRCARGWGWLAGAFRPLGVREVAAPGPARTELWCGAAAGEWTKPSTSPPTWSPAKGSLRPPLRCFSYPSLSPLGSKDSLE